MDVIRTDLDQRSSKHLEDEERATRARIQAYEKVQLDALRAQKMRVEEEQLAMFRLLVRSQNENGSDVLTQAHYYYFFIIISIIIVIMQNAKTIQREP